MSESYTLLATELGQLLCARQLKIGTAESCTGGLVAAAITDIAGSSGWFDEGLVTYANESKQRLLGVSASDLQQYGAVSQPVVEAMVKGVLARGAGVAVATSGIAGPDGGTPDKPVGTVWFACGVSQGPVVSRRLQLDGDRNQVRQQAVAVALQLVLKTLEESSTV